MVTMTAPATAPGPAAPQSASFVRSAAGVAVATGVGNALVYVLYAALSRSLGPTAYGAYAALAAVGFVTAVPALAVQAVVARHVAVRGLEAESGSPEVRVLLGWANRFGMVLGAIGLAITPLITVFLHLPGPAAAAWNGLWVWPVTVLGGYLGVLQGAGRLRSFGRLFLMASGSRLVLTLAGAGVGRHFEAGLATALAGTALAAAVTVALGVRMVGITPFARTRRPGLFRETVAASGGLLGVVVLCNVDLLLARHYLSGHASGIYAIGTIIAKGVFFLPAFVGYVGYRDFTNAARRRRSLARALFAVVVLAMVAVVGAALVAGPVVRAASGPRYSSIAGDAWLFAVLGGVLACVQLLVYAGIAAGHHALARLVWVTVAVEALVLTVFAHASVLDMVTAAVVINLLLAAIATVLVLRPPRPPRTTRQGEWRPLTSAQSRIIDSNSAGL